MTATQQQIEKMLEFGAFITHSLGYTTGTVIAMVGNEAYALRAAAAGVAIQLMAAAVAHPEYYAALIQLTGAAVNPDALVEDFPLEITQEVPA